MKATGIAKTFPAFFYWGRLPGFAAFCGVSVGICAARLMLAYSQHIPSNHALCQNILISAMSFSFLAGILHKRPIFRALFFAIGAVALFCGAEFRIRNFYGNMEKISENRQIFTIAVRITSPVATTRQGVSKFRCKVAGANEAEVERALKGKTLSVTARGSAPPYGMITIQGKYAAPRPAAGPLGFDQREHFAVNNMHGSFSVSRIIADNDTPLADGQAPPAAKRLTPTKGSPTDKLSYSLRMQIHKISGKSPNPDARAILHAAFLNEKELLTESLNTTFRRAGIIHLLAISGFHAALLYSAVFAVLGLLAVPAKQRTLLSLAFLWSYLFFIGFIPSLFRATVMVTFFCLSMMLQRKNHAVHSLGMSGVLWLIISPHSLFAPGFQLSFAATAGIIMLLPVFNTLTRAINSKIHGKPAKFLVEKTLAPLWVSLASFAATAPPLLYHFGTLSLYGIFFNLIAIPLMSAAMWLFFIAAALSPIGIITAPLVWGSEQILALMICLSDFSNRISLSEVVANVTAIQLLAMIIFMIGICAIRKKAQGRYALWAGAAAMFIIAASALYASTQTKTQNLEFKRDNSIINVIIHKDNSAWIVAQGSKSEIRQLRTREIESLLYRKKIRNVPLFIINEDAEGEAHEFAFTTGFNPRIIVLQKKYSSTDKSKRPDINDRYAIINHRTFASADGACSLYVNRDGRMEIVIGAY